MFPKMKFQILNEAFLLPGLRHSLSSKWWLWTQRSGQEPLPSVEVTPRTFSCKTLFPTWPKRVS